MPVQKSKLTATCNINRIVQGEALTLLVEVFDDVTKQVLDFSDDALTAATATFPGTEDDVTVDLDDGLAVSDDPGRLTIALDAEQTAALATGDEQSWEIRLELGGETRIVQLVEVLEVVASLF